MEHFCRQDLDESAVRGFAVLHPLKVTLLNFPEDKIEERSAPNFPGKKDSENHTITLSR